MSASDSGFDHFCCVSPWDGLEPAASNLCLYRGNLWWGRNLSKPTIDGFSYLEVTHPKAKKLGNCMAHFEVAEGTRIGWRAILQIAMHSLSHNLSWTSTDSLRPRHFQISQWTSYTSMIFLFSHDPKGSCCLHPTWDDDPPRRTQLSPLKR